MTNSSKMKLTTAIFAVLCTSCISTSTNTSDASAPIQVFIVSGQSNAVGYNNIRGYHGGREPFPQTLAVQPRILFWPGTEAAMPGGSNIWTTLRVGASGSFGPEISFGHDLQQAVPRVQIAIIKFAVGGTGIARSADYTDYIPAVAHFNDHGRNWHPPDDGRRAGILYDELLADVREATDALDRKGKKWKLAGFVWMQGEHEAGISLRMAEDYKTLLTDFIRSLRKDLRSPSLPLVIGGVNDHTWRYKDIARRGQAEVCQKDRHAVLVPTLDLPRNTKAGDGAHFDADGMLTLGSRFAEAMLDQIHPAR